MELNDLFKLIKIKKQTLMSVALLFLVIVLVFTFIQPLKYSSTSKLLLVQESSVGTDAYSILRSNQFLSSILAEVVYSNTFLEQVLSSGYNIDSKIFSAEINKKQKQWRKAVSSVAVSDTGMIIIRTYHQDRYQASQLNQAVTYTLMSKHQFYHGFKNRISVKVIDTTTTSNWPAKPNILMNLLFGLAIGSLLGVAYIIVLPNSIFKLWPRISKGKKEIYESKIEKRYDNNKEPEDNWHSIGDLIGKIEKEKKDEYFRPNEIISKEDKHKSAIDLNNKIISKGDKCEKPINLNNKDNINNSLEENEETEKKVFSGDEELKNEDNINNFFNKKGEEENSEEENYKNNYLEENKETEKKVFSGDEELDLEEDDNVKLDGSMKNLF